MPVETIDQPVVVMVMPPPPGAKFLLALTVNAPATEKEAAG